MKLILAYWQHKITKNVPISFTISGHLPMCKFSRTEESVLSESDTPLSLKFDTKEC